MDNRLFTTDDLELAIRFFIEYAKDHPIEQAIDTAITEIVNAYDAQIAEFDTGNIDNLPPGERLRRAMGDKGNG